MNSCGFHATKGVMQHDESPLFRKWLPMQKKSESDLRTGFSAPCGDHTAHPSGKMQQVTLRLTVPVKEGNVQWLSVMQFP